MRIAVKLNTVKAHDRFLAVCAANGVIPMCTDEFPDLPPQVFTVGHYACVWSGVEEYELSRSSSKCLWWVDKFMSINQLERHLRGN